MPGVLSMTRQRLNDALCEVCKKALATYKQTIEKTVQVEAFDLCDAGVSTDHLGFLKKDSNHRNAPRIDEWMVCTKEILPLDKPDQKKVYLWSASEKADQTAEQNDDIDPSRRKPT